MRVVLSQFVIILVYAMMITMFVLTVYVQDQFAFVTMRHNASVLQILKYISYLETIPLCNNSYVMSAVNLKWMDNVSQQKTDKVSLIRVTSHCSLIVRCS